MSIQGEYLDLFIMGYYSKDQVDNAENSSTSRCFMTNLACMMVVRKSDLNIMNGLQKLIDNLNLLAGLGSLIELDSNRPGIARLIKL